MKDNNYCVAKKNREIVISVKKIFDQELKVRKQVSQLVLVEGSMNEHTNSKRKYGQRNINIYKNQDIKKSIYFQIQQTKQINNFIVVFFQIQFFNFINIVIL
ncbi:hypothetical protein ABPG74_002054 [Tetrahymena malaccensis]